MFVKYITIFFIKYFIFIFYFYIFKFVNLTLTLEKPAIKITTEKVLGNIFFDSVRNQRIIWVYSESVSSKLHKYTQNCPWVNNGTQNYTKSNFFQNLMSTLALFNFGFRYKPMVNFEYI